MAHIAVERNRRRQMNDNLKALRSLTPSFYIKRGDQASVIGGVIEFINELHLVLQSLESNKRRKSLSPSPTQSPRPPNLHFPNISKPLFDDHRNNTATEIGATCNSSLADVEAKISGGSNVALKTISRRISGQLVKIILVLLKLDFEILHLNITSMDDTVPYTFLLKIGLECPVIVEELAFEVQEIFCSGRDVLLLG